MAQNVNAGAFRQLKIQHDEIRLQPLNLFDGYRGTGGRPQNVKDLLAVAVCDGFDFKPDSAVEFGRVFHMKYGIPAPA